MRIKAQKIEKGLHPNEVVVEVQTLSGAARLVVDKRTFQNNSLAVGSPISERSGEYLVELPRETTSGVWRVWVKSDAVKAA